MPKVSVIIPTFNRARYIREAIDSVLSQAYQSYEIVVIDDGSTDSTREVLAPYGNKIKYFYQENKGLSNARNHGIRESCGEYIALLDSDDLWLPEKLEKQVALLDENPEAAFVCSDTYVIDTLGEVIKVWKKGRHHQETFESLYESNYVYVSTTLIRRQCLDTVGYFDEGLSFSEDYDLWLRLSGRYTFKHMPACLAKYRVHENNMSKNFDTRVYAHRIIAHKPEIARRIGFVRKNRARAKDYYLCASLHYAASNFHKAGINYLKSALYFPFIGYYYYPKETENFRFSLPYRLLKPYLSVVECLLKVKRLKRPVFKLTALLLILFYGIKHTLKGLRVIPKRETTKIGLLNIEFFHEDAGGFGGYGKNAKDITNFFNSNGNPVKIEILLARLKNSGKPSLEFLHNTPIVRAANTESSHLANALRYAFMLNTRHLNVLLSMEYCTDYQYALFFLPKTPLIIWIRDPRPQGCLKKIATVKLELLANSKNNQEELEIHDRNIKKSLGKVITLSRLLKRKIIFAATAHFLIERAKELYGLSDIAPIVLPTPVSIPNIDKPAYSSKPSVCFLGRLDPVKRPWIFFELAKRFKDVDFYVAGNTHYPKIMEPIIREYTAIPNLKFLGLIDGKEKDALLRNTCALVNTSIHEGLPASFLESFSFAKPVLSCQNPDNLTERFGAYTGELLGDGLDNHTLDIFAEALEGFLSKKDQRIEKGLAARKYVEETHSFQKFEHRLKEIIRGFN